MSSVRASYLESRGESIFWGIGFIGTVACAIVSFTGGLINGWPTWSIGLSIASGAIGTVGFSAGLILKGRAHCLKEAEKKRDALKSETVAQKSL